MTDKLETQWDLIIEPKKSLFDVNLRELLRYRDLLFMFIRRDIVTVYKQTILGPIWYILQPVLTVLVFIIVFKNIAGISTDGLPAPLFYLSGVVMWNYFSECFEQTSDTFFMNAEVFGKVYFPRLIMPLTKIVSAMIKFMLQFSIFLFVFIYYYLKPVGLQPNITIFMIPFLLILMAGLGLGAGLIFSSLTIRYRDLKYLIKFGVQLLMYATPVIYPMSMITNEYRHFIAWNPLGYIIEGFRYAFLGVGEFTMGDLLYSTLFTFTILLIGVLLFNKTEQDFMDTI